MLSMAISHSMYSSCLLSGLYLRDQVSLTQGLLLRFFGNSTYNTSKYIVIIVLWFASLLYSLRIEFRVIICSVSVVLGLGYL
jgi:hypothetical protein